MEQIVNVYRTVIGVGMWIAVLLGAVIVIVGLSSGNEFVGLLLAVTVAIGATIVLGLSATVIAIHDQQAELARSLVQLTKQLQLAGVRQPIAHKPTPGGPPTPGRLWDND